MMENGLEREQNTEKVAKKMTFFKKNLTPPSHKRLSGKLNLGSPKKKNQKSPFFAKHTTLIRSKINLDFFENAASRRAKLFRPMLWSSKFQKVCGIQKLAPRTVSWNFSVASYLPL